MRLTKGYMLVPSTWRCQKCSTPCVHKFGNIFFKFYLHVQDTIPKVCWLPNYKELGVHFEISLKKRSEICPLPRRFRVIHACRPLLAWMTRKNSPWIKRITWNSSLRYLPVRATSHKQNELIEGSEWTNTLISLVCRYCFGQICIFWKILLNSENCFEIKVSNCGGFFAWRTHL